jgi:hypothetical protein
MICVLTALVNPFVEKVSRLTRKGIAAYGLQDEQVLSIFDVSLCVSWIIGHKQEIFFPTFLSVLIDKHREWCYTANRRYICLISKHLVIADP